MNIFHKVALQGLKKNRTRTLVTIIGVILSAAMITAVTTFGVSLLDYVTRGAIQKNGDWQVAFPAADAAFAEEQADNELVNNIITTENLGYAEYENKSGAEESRPYLFLTAYDDRAMDKLPITMMKGRLPENSSEIVISGKAAAEAGGDLDVGDTITLSLGERQAGGNTLWQNTAYTEGENLTTEETKTYTVVGSCRRPGYEPDNPAGYTLITKADNHPTAGISVFVNLKDPYTLSSYLESVGTAAGSHVLNNDVLRFMGLSDDNLFTGLLLSIGLIVLLIIMIGSIFMIYNSFSISLSERTHQLGILMSVGATARQLKRSVLFEGFCIGLLGIPLGVLAGLGCIRGVIEVVKQNFSNVLYADTELVLVISAAAIGLAAVVSLLTILISAYIPARKAAAMPVMDCIRQSNEIKTTAKAVKTSQLSARIYGLPGTLALKNFKRNKRRYRSIILSLALSVVLFITVNSFVTDLNKTSEGAVVFTTHNMSIAVDELPESDIEPLLARLKAADGVTDGLYQGLLMSGCTVNTADLSSAMLNTPSIDTAGKTLNLDIQMQFIDDAAYANMVQSLGLPAAEYTGENPKFIAVAKLMAFNDNRVHEVDEFPDMFKSAAQNLDITPKENGTAGKNTQNINITCVSTLVPDIVIDMKNAESGTVKDSPYLFQLLAPYSQKDRFVTPTAPLTNLGFSLNSKACSSSESAFNQILTDEGVSDYHIYNMGKLAEDNNNMIFIVNVFGYIFIIMISLIAVANVFNTISTNIRLRRRELAMLRSVGMSEREFRRMMNFECVFYGARALIFGLPVAGVLSWLIFKGMYAGGADNLDYAFPWLSMAISIVCVLLIVFITMLYATGKLKKENIIDALRDEMS